MVTEKNAKPSLETRFKCDLCGMCCSLYCVPVTHHDLKLILTLLNLPFKGKSIGKIAEFIEPDESVADTYEDIPRPLLEDYDSTDLILVTKSDEYCDFYSNQKKGCKIYSARPQVCRFFPYTYEYEEEFDWTNPPLDLESMSIEFSINEECNFCKGLGEGSNFDFAVLTETTHQGTREDADFFKLVYKWNLGVLFNQIPSYAEDDFFQFLVENFPPE